MSANPPPTPPTGRAPTATGRVLAVCAGERSLAKAALAEARVTRLGVPGDVHYDMGRRGETHATKDGPVPNDRPITVVAVEAVRAACEGLGIDVLPPGGLGENVLVEGLGDLSDLARGDVLRLAGAGGPASDVVLEVTQQNRPCQRLCSWHPGMKEALVGRRGVICVVLQEGAVRPGHVVEVVRAPR